MARSRIFTSLPLDQYAELNEIDMDAFSQCYRPVEEYPSSCNLAWPQFGWYAHDGRILGRDDVAGAIHDAERLISLAMQTWVAPRWFTGEEHPWPRAKQGRYRVWPPIQANWGKIIAGGQRATSIIEADAPIVYTDVDGDGTVDTATITIAAATMTAAGASADEVAVFYPDHTTEEWRIAYVRVQTDALGNVVITGRRSWFPVAALLNNADAISLEPVGIYDDNFLATVDVVRLYNDPAAQAQLVYNGDTCTFGTLCGVTCQSACLEIQNYESGIVSTPAASYSGGTWSLGALTGAPVLVRLWYQAGQPLEDGRMEHSLALAVTRLANVLLPEAPCGCDKLKARWRRDREEQDINTYDAALCMSAFGTVTKGSLYTWSVVKHLSERMIAGSL